MTPLNIEIYENTKTYVKLNIKMHGVMACKYAYLNTI